MAYLAAGRAEEAKAAFTRRRRRRAARGLEDRMMQQVRSNLRLVEKVGPEEEAGAAAARAGVKPVALPPADCSG